MAMIFFRNTESNTELKIQNILFIDKKFDSPT
jgi:hypothetical protein